MSLRTSIPAQPTPGEWSLESDGLTIVMAGQCVATAIAPDGASIAEQRANARLIAASKDLLAAAKAMLEDRDRWPVLTGLCCSDAAIAMERAIAKAEGR